MVAGARTDGGNHQPPQQRQTSTQVRKVIQSLKEIVGNHSDADIYAVLKESNMDPNETAQKLLNQDPFHEVKRKRDKKKELTGYSGFSDTRRHMQYNIQSAKSYIAWDGNVQRRDYSRNKLPGSNREVRVVREYRVKQNAKSDVNPESVHNSASEKEQAKFNLQNISSTGVLGDQKQLATLNSEGLMSSVRQPCDSAAGHTKGVVPTSTCMSPLLGKTQATASTLNSQIQREGQDSPKENSSLTLSNSVVGVYSSASDPVHVPSPASRPAGTVGAIRREVGVVGVRKQSSCQSATNSTVPNSSLSVPLSAKDISSPKESFEQSGGTPKHNQINQVVVSDLVTSNESTRSFSGNQQNIKLTQHSTGHQKAIQSTMEWKPKSSQKPTVISPIVTSLPSSSCAEDASGSSNPADVSNLSKKLSQVNVLEEPHVIIPQHLQVPESEYTKLTFGSFAAGFDSTKSFSSACQALKNAELRDEPSVSLSVSVPVRPSENTSADDQVDMSACQASSRSESPASATETELSPSGNTESLNHQSNENYADIGLVESQSPPYSSPQTHQLPAPASLPSFSAYEPRSSYGVPYLRTVAEDNIHGQGFCLPEALRVHATNNNSSSAVALMQPQQQSMQQQQQQPVTNLYPQVHFSHFPNFVPYRHVFSPVYGPPMAIPNYSNNPAYPHPSNGSNYFLMPGGSSHIAAAGVKYAPSQYKAVPSGSPSGYGNYTNPTGFTLNAPGSVGGATGLEDMNRTRYKDNNLYVPNPQAETSDMWIQTPRELPSLQPASYYNLSAQQPHTAAAAAFMPAAHGGHASFNAAAAAPSSHVQYPTLYHPSPSPASLTAHHLVHQSGIGGSIGAVGMAAAAPGSQVGAYQQPQLGHANWPTNF